ncbi:hypothetical protein QL285_028315 [Trifolium repens]|nr:hypothetical protein QL285_028315 [Trifolium repens]
MMAISSSLPTNNNSLFSVSRPRVLVTSSSLRFISTTAIHFHNYSLHNKIYLRRWLNSVRKLSGVPVPMIAMATEVQEVLPPPLTSTSPPPSLFDGTTMFLCFFLSSFSPNK